MTKEDKMLMALVLDKINQCEDKYMPTSTGFLDMHQRTVISHMLRQTKVSCDVVFYGGYDDAERVLCLFLPDYANLSDNHGLAIIRATKRPGGKALTHRDYLGSLLGLGIKRELIGDIIVYDEGADIILLDDIAEFILFNYDKAGRTMLSLEKRPIEDLKQVEGQYKDITDTIASLRLDNVISSAFGISRSKALEAIKRGMAFVNSMEVAKPDKEVCQGDKVVLRGKGKAYLKEIGGRSRKDRIYVTFRVYGR